MASNTVDHKWLLQQVQKRKNSKRKRLAYMFLDVFLGGFVVGIVLMSTLGKPVAEEPAIGGGGEAFILVEFEWDSFEQSTVAHGLSPIIKHNGTNLKAGGFAAPYNEDLPIWAEHSRETGLIDHDKLEATPFELISVEGFHLRTIEKPMRVVNSSGLTQYGYIWISKPCSGIWEFGVRPVGPAISATQPISMLYRLYYGNQKLDLDSQVINVTGNAEESPEVAGATDVFQAIKLSNGSFTFSLKTDWDDDEFIGC